MIRFLVGTQQKVCYLEMADVKSPGVRLWMIRPAGIDVGAKYEIYKLMNDLAQSRGLPLIMISSELEEVLGMSDRVMVMCEGKSAGTLDIAEATQERNNGHSDRDCQWAWPKERIR